MIRLENVTVSYGDRIVFDNFNHEFQSGLIHGIAGLNGAGKTTLFNSLANVIKQTTGSITFNGNQIKKGELNYFETVNYFYSSITGNEYLKIFKQTNSSFDLNALQGYFNLPLDNLIETYSTGMKKKLALLGLLKKDSEIYLFDEPFNGLDMETNKIVELIVLNLKKKNKTIFISSHIINPLYHICDQIHHLDKGQLKKTFQRNEFDSIEQELFGKFKEEASSIIERSI